MTTISNEVILEWIDRVSNVQDVKMDPNALVDDVILMAYVFHERLSFLQAMNSVVRALEQIVNEKVSVSQLEHNLRGWDSYHFQSQRLQGQGADLRIIYQHVDSGSVYVRGFGHRHLPSDIYKRLYPY